MKIAFVLVGGAVKGAFQVGVLKELLKRKIEPEAVFGTSIGALNGALLLSSKNLNKNIKLMENYWRGIRKKDMFPLYVNILYKAFFFSPSIYSTKGIKSVLHKFIKRDDFSYLSKKLYVIVTDYSNGEPVFFSKGRLIEKIIASCSVPGLFPPKKIDGKYYIDGGFSGVLGIKKAEQLKYDIIILINLSSDTPKKMSSFYNIFLSTLDFSMLNMIEREIKQLKKSKIIEIRVSKKFSGRFMDFKAIDSLIKNGEREAKKILDKYKIYSKQDLKKFAEEV